MIEVKSSRMWGLQPSRRRNMLCGAVAKKWLPPHSKSSQRLAIFSSSVSSACRAASERAVDSAGLIVSAFIAMPSGPAREWMESMPASRTCLQTQSSSSSSAVCAASSCFRASSSTTRSASDSNSSSLVGRTLTRNQKSGRVDLLLAGRRRQFTSRRSPCASWTPKSARPSTSAGPACTRPALDHGLKATCNSKPSSARLSALGAAFARLPSSFSGPGPARRWGLGSQPDSASLAGSGWCPCSAGRWLLDWLGVLTWAPGSSGGRDARDARGLQSVLQYLRHSLYE
mmetsp:Transcript_14204/g.41417  ORF Transcript_14204/g.41417 Transcript_14204/m.41417 type:complete len:286 (+) Transcript_14204:315-1172(+)